MVIINSGPNYGKIIVAGSAFNGARRNFALARYNTDGTLDTSFGPSGTGKVTTSFFYNGQSSSIDAMALDTSGRIVVAGRALNGSNYDFAMARYNANGTLDTSFNHHDFFCFFGSICNGKQRADFNGGNDYVSDIAIQQNGKIVLAGQAYNGRDYDFALARYNTNGRPDTSFGANGTSRVTLPFYRGKNDMIRAMALQTDGKIVAAGMTYRVGTGYDFALARFNINGTLDTSFNYQSGYCINGQPCNGQVVTDFNVSTNPAYAVTIDGSGKIVVAGYAYNGRDYDFALARYNIDGSLDTSFGTAGTGKVTTDFGDWDFLYAATLQSDGKIIAAGSTRYNRKFALARYLP